MRLLLVAGVVACGSSRVPAVADAPTPDGGSVDTPPVHWSREATAVIVGPTRVVWSLGPVGCPIEGSPDCAGSTPTVLASTGPSVPPTTLNESVRGTTVAGDENELFYIDRDGAGTFGGVLTRLRPGETPVALAPPSTSITDPAVDATYVYWAESASGAFAIRRATRTGDGSDATTIATTPSYPYTLRVFSGYVYWGTQRVAATGGTPEPISASAQLVILGVGPTVLYTVEPLPPNGFTRRIGTLAVDGTTTTLADLSLDVAPASPCVYDRGDLFWSTSANALYRMPATGGTPAMLGDVVGAFGATADAVLFGFTDAGYQSVPR